MTSTHEHCKIESIKDERLLKRYHLVQIIMADQPEAGIFVLLSLLETIIHCEKI
jgi:hypothetical protein